MEIKLNSYGAIIYPEFHDGNLIKIELENENIILTTKDIKKEFYEIFLEGVMKFRVIDFLEGNIIFEVIIQKEEALMANLCDLFAISEKEFNSRLDCFGKIIDKIKKGELILFHISCSYGCELYALAKRINFRKMQR